MGFLHCDYLQVRLLNLDSQEASISTALKGEARAVAAAVSKM